MKSLECNNLYWAIPIGNYDIETIKQKKEFKSI